MHIMNEKLRKKIDFSSKEVITSSFGASKNIEDISISELEKVLDLYRKKGSETELLAFIKDITKKQSKEKQTFYIENTLKEIKVLILDKFNLKNAKNFAKNILNKLKNNYVKRVLGFFGIFFAIYLTLNLPIYYNRISWYLGDKTEKKTVKVSELEQKPMAKSAPLEAGEVVPPDSTLIVPKLNVNSPIVFLDSQKEKDVQAGLQGGVVRFGRMSNPGEAGNTYLIGHSSNYWWDKGKYNYVFLLLDKMEAGDSAKIYHNGNKYLYEVVEKEIVEPNNTASLNQTNEPILTLMTCYPPGTTNKRLIVKLKQTAPQYFAPRLVEKEKVIEFPKKLPSTDSGSLLGSLKKFFLKNN